MSAGLHRLWKRFAVDAELRDARARACSTWPAAPATSRGSSRSASGRRARSCSPTSMRRCSRRGATGCSTRDGIIPAVRCDGERLPFPADRFDCVSIAFGLRNMTRKDAALAEMRRVLQPGRQAAGAGVLARCGSRSRRSTTPIRSRCCRGSASWSRAMPKPIATSPNRSACIPDQDELKQMMEQAGFERVDYFNLAAGVVALHRGYKFCEQACESGKYHRTRHFPEYGPGSPGVHGGAMTRLG